MPWPMTNSICGTMMAHTFCMPARLSTAMDVPPTKDNMPASLTLRRTPKRTIQ